jgi:adenylyltransferase/sulfurtransferase
LLDATGKVRSYVNVYLGDEDTRYLQGNDTNVSPGDRLEIVPSIAGG